MTRQGEKLILAQSQIRDSNGFSQMSPPKVVGLIPVQG